MKWDQRKCQSSGAKIPEKNTGVDNGKTKHTGEYLDEGTKTGPSSPLKEAWPDKNGNSETKAYDTDFGSSALIIP